MVPAIHGIYRMDSQNLDGPIFHPLLATSSIFWHNRCCRGGGQAHYAIRAIACIDCWHQSAPIHTFQQISPSLLCQIFVLIKKGVLVPLDLHKLTLVGPPSMRDDLYSYLLPLLL
jgi:hypothetical protein